MASNAKNLAELLNQDSTVAVGDIADGSITTAKLATPVTLVGANTLTLRNDTSVDANEPKLIFDNDTFAGANYANITTGNGGLLMKIESPSTSTFQNRHQILMNAGGGDDIQFNSSTNNGSSYTTQMKIEAGDVTIGNGNLVIGTSGKGIDFSATSNSSGSMANELFSDYEEGTFTPTFNTTGGGESFTYTTQLGYYLKVGAFVWVSMAVGWSNRSGGSGQLRLGNLPFAPAGGSRRALAGMPYSDCWTGLSNAYNIQPHSNLPSAANGTYFWYTNGQGNIASYIQSADLSSSGNLQTVLGYESSA